jgi:hypothetical protein
MSVFYWWIDCDWCRQDIAFLNGQDQDQQADLIPSCPPNLTRVNLGLARFAESLAEAGVGQCALPRCMFRKIKKLLWHVRVTHGVLPYHSTEWVATHA